MSELKDGRLGVTLLDSDYAFLAENDEMMVNKRTGRLIYKNKVGEIIDIFQRYASNVSEERLIELETVMHRIIQLVTENGPAKMVHFKYALEAEVDNQKLFNIPLKIFNRDTDLLILNVNSSIPLEDAQYSINDQNQVVLHNGVKLGTRLMILIIKNMPQSNEDGGVSGNVIINGSIGIDKLSPEVVTLIGGAKVPLGTITEQHLAPELAAKIGKAEVKKGSITEEHLDASLVEKFGKLEIKEGSILEEHLAPELVEKLKRLEVKEGSIDITKLDPSLKEYIDNKGLKTGSVSIDHFDAALKEYIDTRTLSEGSVSVQHLDPVIRNVLNAAAMNTTPKSFFQDDEPETSGILWLKPVETGGV